jgi:excisionase family DNA binding protein
MLYFFITCNNFLDKPIPARYAYLYEMPRDIMEDLMTARQIGEILKVDRITIYRMLGDGRLRGFKVGGQWRFSRSELESWLREQFLEPDAHMPNGAEKSGEQTSQVLPLSCIQAVQSIFADAMDIAAVTTDTEGQALTQVSNGCDFCGIILSSEEGRRRCSASWKSLRKAEIHCCHAGLLGVGDRITTKGKWVGIVAGCQFALRGGTKEHDLDWQEKLPMLATELDLSENSLQAAATGVHTIQADHQTRLSRLMRQVAETFSKIGEERLALLDRLERIAAITNLES